MRPAHQRLVKEVLGLLIVSLLGTTPVWAKNLTVHMIANDAGANYLTSKMIPEFEQKHGTKVDLERVGWGTRHERLVVTTAAGVPPDLFMSGAEHVQELVHANLLAPIDQYFDALPDKSDFFPPALGSSQFRGRQYGLPIYTAPRVYWYRTDLFSESGLDPARPPGNWSELLQAARLLTRTDGTRVTRQGYDLERWTGTNIYSNTQEFATFLMQNGGRLINPDTFEAEFSDQTGIETLEFMVQLRNAVQPPGYTVDAGSGPGNRLFRGVSVMRLDTSAAIRDFYNPALDLSRSELMRAIVPPPGQKQGVSLVFSDWLGIHAASTQKELAWEYLKTMTSATVLRDYDLAAGYQSPRRSTLRDFTRQQPMVAWVYETLNYCVPFPVYPNSEAAMRAFSNRYVAVIQSKEGVSSALSEAARLWNISVGAK